jgi:hypothetical protein
MGQWVCGFSASRLLLVLAASLTLAACGDQSKTVTDAVTGVTVPSAPLALAGVPPTEAPTGVSYSFKPQVMNASGAVKFSVMGMPVWMTIDPSSGVLSGTPAAGDVGTSAEITLMATTSNAAGSIGPFRVQVTSNGPVPAAVRNSAPIIHGNPPTSVIAGLIYNFAPATFDADANAMTFSIVNRPSWAMFNPLTGQLSGTPTAASVGMQSDILISVSDGFVTVSLPAFSINVLPPPAAPPAAAPPAAAPPAAAPPAAAPPTTTAPTTAPPTTTGSTPAPANSPPTISGSAPDNVTAGASYSFTPTAVDADNDALSFAIQNKPQWAQFDSATGQLTGTPAAGDAGVYMNVWISVSDGKATAALTLFSITVAADSNGGSGGSALVSWDAPQANTDGSMLSDLTGYNVYYGKDPNNLTLAVQLDCGWCVWTKITNLTPGTWYFAVKSYNKLGVESDFSAIASKDIS